MRNCTCALTAQETRDAATKGWPVPNTQGPLTALFNGAEYLLSTCERTVAAHSLAPFSQWPELFLWGDAQRETIGRGLLSQS
jgi:hypothetical protein